MSRQFYDLEDQVRQFTPSQREWLIKLELANYKNVERLGVRRRKYEAEKFRRRAIKHILAGGGSKIR